MTHIAKCIRESVMDKRLGAHIQDATSAASRNEQPERPDSRTALNRSHSKRGQPRYQLWPTKKEPTIPDRPQVPYEKRIALSVQRSATAMGDAIVTSGCSASRKKDATISNRRKVSVPDMLAPPPKERYEALLDSPTIPGYFPVGKESIQPIQERSESAPPNGNQWRANPFGDAMISCVTGPALLPKVTTPPSASSGSPAKTSGPCLPMLKPLSPILSPTSMTSGQSRLQVNTKVGGEEEDMPPEVPPKSPSLYTKKSPATRPQPRMDFGNADPTIGEDPAGEKYFIEGRCSSPESLDKRDRPIVHRRRRSGQSVMSGGNSYGRTPQRVESRAGSRAESRAGQTASPTDGENTDTWRLPRGLPASVAVSTLANSERERLSDKAYGQVEKFEVLNCRDVNSLTKELHALDERCDYLRRTYKSLREGRQRLHARMLSYLRKSETVCFNRDSLLKQEEALVELDISIDDWIFKIEQAEGRRTRIREKLLEHVAAAVVMPCIARSTDETCQTTPPRSPVKADSPDRPYHTNRKDVESIRIYADGEVLNLFADLEKAIGHMCDSC
ncbi:Up-regulated during septation-domain-containing protein [Phyllosticta citriasiana]|uniref:Up-regulated during septation-domain-containing protein n=1 Tax=Phyllosticta citriasiana TaxID=595635 RepID=A0ABR1KTN4_9PEZI